jgi:predicted nuclease of predicted toxin-antitoxin system
VKLLLDACVWGKAADQLRALGHDVDWAGDWSEDPGDEEILRRANREGRVLITIDKDFGELAILKDQPHSGIVRLVNFSARQQASICAHVINLHTQELQSGSLLTVEPGRVRIRPASV